MGVAGGPSAADSDVTLPRDVARALGGGGGWISSWWTVAAVLGVVAGAVVWAALRRRRGRRAWPGAMVAVPAAILAAAIGANAYVGYIPTTDALRVTLSSWGIGSPPTTAAAVPGAAQSGAGGEGVGAVSSASVPAPASLKMPSDALTWVYTPPGYDPAGSVRYPVVYLVHGEPGQAGDWIAAGDAGHTMDVLIDQSAVRPMIVVSVDVNGTGPSAGDTECLDSTTGGSQVETYLNTVMVPWVDAHYATVADASHRAVGGFSSGGFCALDQGLRHPDTFGTILSIAGYTEPGSGGTAMLATADQRAAHDVAGYVSGLDGAGRHVFLSTGGDEGDQGVLATRDLADPLRADGFDVATQILPHYGHTWVYARAALPYGIVFFSQSLTASASSPG
jgi:enterochelin esterase-like enzyme